MSHSWENLERDCTAEFNYNTLASRAKAFDHSTYMYVIEQGSCKNEYGIGCGTRSPELLYLSKISWDYRIFPSLRNYVKKKKRVISTIKFTVK